MTAVTPARRVESDAALERIVIDGDLRRLDGRARWAHYARVCSSLGLNPVTQPLRFLVLEGRLTLYITRDGTDQLRARHKVSIQSCDAKLEDGLYIVTARAVLPDGRTDEDLGAVSLEGLKGNVRANAIMKAITKAKRRVTLSLVGLGLLDESEVEDIPGAVRVELDETTGEIKSPEAAPPMPDSAEAFAGVAYANLDHERDVWLKRITEAATERKLDVKRRQELWMQHVGLDASQKTADPAALEALYNAVVALPKS